MKHYGDITKINGAEVEPVWIVCGGSPCQDLSVAGKRAGLKHADKGDEETTRSGLFMDQIRIIKEMREHDKASGRTDKFIRPRFMVWENVPGAFSSNNGEDFRAVLEETAKVADKDAFIPGPPKGKWTPAGCIMGDGWSIAWRVHDAQFWGVPQRRKRIALVADFGGESAPEILFEREGMSGHPEPCDKERETVTADVTGSIGETGWVDGVKSCLDELKHEPNAFTLKIRGGIEVDSKGNKAGKGPLVQTELSGTLGVSQDQTLITSMGFNKGTSNQLATNDMFVTPNMSVVRRLTPMECERLQGFPDGWTDIGDWVDSKGKKHKGDSDSPRYKALGNSIALPFWKWMAKRMVNVLKADGVEDLTMASLFDGIGGFPLSYSEASCKPVWASEIEEFPIAVTKLRFPEKE